MDLDAEAVQLVFLPLLTTLDITVTESARSYPVLPLRLPFDKSPNLRALALRDFVRHYSHDCSEEPIFDRELPQSVKTLLLSVPDGQLLNLAPQWPHLQSLYINGRKTSDMLDARHLSSLEVLQLDAAPYGAESSDFAALYGSLSSCTALRYLRVNFMGCGCVCDAHGFADAMVMEVREAFGRIVDLPNLWFCEVPHQVPHTPGWLVAKENVEPGQCRVVNKGSEFYDAQHMHRLATSVHALVAELDFDRHLETV